MRIEFPGDWDSAMVGKWLSQYRRPRGDDDDGTAGVREPRSPKPDPKPGGQTVVDGMTVAELHNALARYRQRMGVTRLT